MVLSIDQQILWNSTDLMTSSPNKLAKWPYACQIKAPWKTKTRPFCHVESALKCSFELKLVYYIQPKYICRGKLKRKSWRSLETPEKAYKPSEVNLTKIRGKVKTDTQIANLLWSQTEYTKKKVDYHDGYSVPFLKELPIIHKNKCLWHI